MESIQSHCLLKCATWWCSLILLLRALKHLKSLALPLMSLNGTHWSRSKQIYAPKWLDQKEWFTITRWMVYARYNAGILTSAGILTRHSLPNVLKHLSIISENTLTLTVFVPAKCSVPVSHFTRHVSVVRARIYVCTLCMFLSAKRD